MAKIDRHGGRMKVYIGMVDGKPMREPFWEYGIKSLSVFTSRRAARKAFQDVRVATLFFESEGIK